MESAPPTDQLMDIPLELVDAELDRYPVYRAPGDTLDAVVAMPGSWYAASYTLNNVMNRHPSACFRIVYLPHGTNVTAWLASEATMPDGRTTTLRQRLEEGTYDDPNAPEQLRYQAWQHVVYHQLPTPPSGSTPDVGQ